MRRRANWLLAVLAIICLIAWGCSYFFPTSESANVWRVGEPIKEGTLRLSLVDGRLGVKYGVNCLPPWANTRGWRFCGILYAVVELPGPTTGYRLHMLGVHLALLVVLFAVSPVIALARGPLRRAWRVRRGRCASCGYDLRGSVSGVCSECGTGIEQSRIP